MSQPSIFGLEWDDAALVRAVQQGDIECFGPLVDRHLAAVRTFLSLKAPVPQLVDEVAHETFLFAYRRLADFQPGTSFRHWLRAIAWNLLRAEVLRFSRRESRFAPLEEVGLLENTAETGMTGDPDAEYLEECFTALSDEARALVNLHYLDGNNSHEIAARLQRSRAWVRTTLFRIRQQLKACIEGKRASAVGAEAHSHG